MAVESTSRESNLIAPADSENERVKLTGSKAKKLGVSRDMHASSYTTNTALPPTRVDNIMRMHLRMRASN